MSRDESRRAYLGKGLGSSRSIGAAQVKAKGQTVEAHAEEDLMLLSEELGEWL